MCDLVKAHHRRVYMLHVVVRPSMTDNDARRVLGLATGGRDPQSQFRVLAHVNSEQAKRDKLQQLRAFDMRDLDVYELEQTA